MAVGRETRVPFLDHHLVEYSMDIPQASKIPGGNKKAILKSALKDIIPDEIINRPKMGFSAPVSDWLRGDLGFEVESSLLSSPLIKDGPLRREPITDMISAHREGRADHALHLWTLYNLTAWHDQWLC